MSVRVSPQGQQLLFGTAGPLLTPNGQLTDANLIASLKKADMAPRFPQTDRWPLPGSGTLSALDYVRIAGVDLPLAEMPKGGDRLDVSKRKAPGSNHATLASHGKDTTPITIILRLFRDQSLGYIDGRVVGADWFFEYERVRSVLIAKSLKQENSVPVYYPTWAARGCNAIVFTEVDDYEHERGGFFRVRLQGYDARSVHKGGASTKVKGPKTIGTRANPVPPQAAVASSAKAATDPPSRARRGK